MYLIRQFSLRPTTNYEFFVDTFEIKYDICGHNGENLCKIQSNAEVNKCFNFQN